MLIFTKALLHLLWVIFLLLLEMALDVFGVVVDAGLLAVKLALGPLIFAVAFFAVAPDEWII